MDNSILLPKPYLSRAIPAERVLIDQKVNAELKRVRILQPMDKNNNHIQHSLDVKNFPVSDVGKPKVDKVSFTRVENAMKLPDTVVQAKVMKVSRDTGALLKKAKSVSSDSISNQPNGNYSIGYICPLTFKSILDYERIWGLVTSTFVWYFVPADSKGDYIISNNGILLGMYSGDKNTITTKETVKWHWDYDLYNKLNFPSVKFKVAVMRYDNGMPGGVTFSDEVIVTFDNSPCINIHSMNITASNSDGGYSSIKGGNHGTEPTLNVHLNAPAPPNGQIVYLSVTGVGSVNPTAWINGGMAQVVIPGGQTHGQFTGFIGSRSVVATKSITVVAGVNGIEGYATLRITKK